MATLLRPRDDGLELGVVLVDAAERTHDVDEHDHPVGAERVEHLRDAVRVDAGVGAEGEDDRAAVRVTARRHLGDGVGPATVGLRVDADAGEVVAHRGEAADQHRVAVGVDVLAGRAS